MYVVKNEVRKSIPHTSTVILTGYVFLKNDFVYLFVFLRIDTGMAVVKK